jgi:hypothetical protein
VFNLPERVRAEIERFFLSAGAFEAKELQLVGWGAPEEADPLVRRAAR